MIIDEVVSIYNKTDSIKKTAKELNISYTKASKLLCTAGKLDTMRFKHITELRKQGLSEDEIAKTLGINKTTLCKYTPYTKTVQNENLSANAIKIRKCRNKLDKQK